jgi:tetratricopeptide (TPR) repeat protein
MAGMSSKRSLRFQRLRRLSDGPFVARTILEARRFVRAYPTFGPGWLELAISLCPLGRYEEAEQALAKAIELCPDSHRALPLAHMGHLFRACGDYDQAAGWYRQAIAADSRDASWRIFLGAVLAKQGKLHEAEEVHRAATECSEGCIDEAFLNRGLVLRGLERFSEAAECFREAIRLDPDDGVAKKALRDVERCIPFERQRRRRQA